MNVVGIDLGTTNSVVAKVMDGKPEVIPNLEGDRTMPSVFVYDDEPVVGKIALEYEQLSNFQVVRSVKRKMGENHIYDFDEVSLTPEDVSAEILSKLKIDAENILGEVIEGAVITVPAYFNNEQRQATKRAGEMAGLRVLRIINEPTAASLSYGLNQKTDQRVLVFDLGGGTFDVTVLDITTDGIFDVKATSGDTKLGGDDFDMLIAEWIKDKIWDEYPSFRFSDHQNRLLIGLAEKAKRELTSKRTARIFIGSAFVDVVSKEPLNIDFKISRTDFNSMCEPLMNRIKVCVDRAMIDSRSTYADIDEIVFVGGSTRMPIVSEYVEKLSGKKPNKTVNPDEVVALGAAIQAEQLVNAKESKVMLFDVTPLTLGVETFGGVTSPLIKRNTTIPVEYTETFTTAEDNQSEVVVNIVQGERPKVEDNISLGNLVLADLTPEPRGVPQIEVTFDIDVNGILSVKARDAKTNKEQSCVIDKSLAIDDQDVETMIRDAEAHKEDDEHFLQLSQIRSVLMDQMHQIEDILRSCGSLSESERDNLRDIVNSIEQDLGTPKLELLGQLAKEAEEKIKAAGSKIEQAAEQQHKKLT